MDSRVFWIWLQQRLPLGDTCVGVLLERFGSPQGVYEADRAALRGLGLPARKIDALCEKSLTRAVKVLSVACSGNDWVLTPDDVGYPERLRRIDGFPLVLYCRGELPDWQRRLAVGVVGTRRATDSGMYNAYSLGAGLAAAGAVVISGGALGIDGQAHRGCMDAGGITVLIKADRLDGDYLGAHADLRDAVVKSGGLIVSEYAPDNTARLNFHVRNRLISGLANGVCLVETPARSGALITARLAREQGRDVFAMPGDVPSHCNDGSHKLIQEGATLVTCAATVLEEYTPWYALDVEAATRTEAALRERYIAPPQEAAPIGRKRKQPAEASSQPPAESETVPCAEGASEAAVSVYRVLQPVLQPIDDIALQVGLPPSAVLVALTELELCGCAVSGPGQRYGLKTVPKAP